MIAFFIALYITGVQIWRTLSVTLFPIIRWVIIHKFPETTTNQYVNITVTGTLTVYQLIFAIIRQIHNYAIVFLMVSYFIYYIAKHVLLKGDPIGSAILEFSILKEFTEFGLFPALDTIGATYRPYMYRGVKSGSIADTLRKFSNDFIKKVKEPKNQITTGGMNNPNLTEAENKIVLEKYEKCMKTSAPSNYKGKDKFKLLSQQLNLTKAKIFCDIQQIVETIKIQSKK